MNLAPNKSLGQHWLSDRSTLEAICDFAGVEAGDMVLEIGPGLGTLTKVLLERGATVHAIEFDPALAAALPGCISSPHLTVEHADILTFDLSVLPPAYKVVANVPYYITSRIVRTLLEAATPPQTSTLLVQKEVAERIAAGPGGMSLLSVAAQFYAAVRLGPVVPAALFAPPPKVDSQVVRLDYTGPKFKDADTKHFFRLVKTGFASRRKKLRSSLAGGLQISKEQADALLQKANIPPDARAQELSLDDWHRLCRRNQSTGRRPRLLR